MQYFKSLLNKDFRDAVFVSESRWLRGLLMKVTTQIWRIAKKSSWSYDHFEIHRDNHLWSIIVSVYMID